MENETIDWHTWGHLAIGPCQGINPPLTWNQHGAAVRWKTREEKRGWPLWNAGSRDFCLWSSCLGIDRTCLSQLEFFDINNSFSPTDTTLNSPDQFVLAGKPWTRIIYRSLPITLTMFFSLAVYFGAVNRSTLLSPRMRKEVLTLQWPGSLTW